MRHLLYIFLLLCFGCSSKQVENSNNRESQRSIIVDSFSLSIMTYNHATELFEGNMKWIITENKLEIHNFSYLFGGSDTTLFLKSLLPNLTLKKISTFKFDTLQEFYINENVMLTSGDELKIEIKKHDKAKIIYLHSYYKNEQIKLLISLANELIPKQYQIEYFTKTQ